MKAILRSRVTKIIAAIVAALGLFAGGVAVASHNAGHVLYSGGGLIQTKVATETDPWATSTPNTWVNVPGSTLTVTVPSGTSRLLNATFNAASYCLAQHRCAVRIVARKAGTSTPTELRPAAGNVFSFDSQDLGGESWQAHSVSRSVVRSAGTWYVYVQAQPVGDGGPLNLDDWNFVVNVHSY